MRCNSLSLMILLCTSACAETEVSMRLTQGTGCITYAPEKESFSSGAWLTGEAAELELQWTRDGDPEGGEEWEVAVNSDAEIVWSDTTTDEQGRLSFPLVGDPFFSLNLQEPGEVRTSAHAVSMRPIEPDQTAVMCAGAREADGRRRRVVLGSREDFEILTNQADGLSVEVQFIARKFKIIGQDELTGHGEGSAVIEGGRAVVGFDVPQTEASLRNQYEAHIRLMDGGTQVGEVEVVPIAVDGVR